MSFKANSRLHVIPSPWYGELHWHWPLRHEAKRWQLAQSGQGWYSCVSEMFRLNFVDFILLIVNQSFAPYYSVKTSHGREWTVICGDNNFYSADIQLPCERTQVDTDIQPSKLLWISQRKVPAYEVTHKFDDTLCHKDRSTPADRKYILIDKNYSYNNCLMNKWKFHYGWLAWNLSSNVLSTNKFLT